jgi:hypothetical protein
VITLRFEDGTIRVGGLDESDSEIDSLPGVTWDDRGLVARAPAHRYAELRTALDEADVLFEDRVLPEERLSLSHAYDLRSYQREAVEAWRANGDRGVVELPTGAGKTVLAIEAIAALGVPTLVVVPTIDLLEQWRRELETEFDVPIGQLGGGEQRDETQPQQAVVEQMRKVASTGYVRNSLTVYDGGRSDGMAEAAGTTGAGGGAMPGAVTAGAQTVAREAGYEAVSVETSVSRRADTRLDRAREARMKGYEGDPCGDCGNFTLVRNGTCMKCTTCGSTSGCS